MSRVALVAPPFAGHLYPLLALGRAAAAAGHRVEVVTGEAKLAAVAAAGLAGRSLPSLAGRALEAVSDTDRPVRGHPGRVLAQLRASLRIATAAKADLLALWSAEPPDVVVADSVAVSAGLAATALGLPWVTTIATPFAIEARRGPPAYLGGWSEGDGLLHRLRDAGGRLVVRAAKRSFAWAVRRQLAALGTGLYRPDGGEAAYSPTAILGFGLAELEFERDWPAAFRMIGPVFADPGPPRPLVLPPDFPADRPRVLISLGTHLPWAKARLGSDLAWLAARRPDVAFVASRGAPESPDPPSRIARNALLVPFLSYATGLPDFDAVVHHGGAGITYAAISAGKPAVVVPHDYDQFDYAARVVAKGAGLRVARLASPATLAALDRVLVPGAFPALAGLSAAARRYRPAEAFLAAIESATGGRSQPSTRPGSAG